MMTGPRGTGSRTRESYFRREHTNRQENPPLIYDQAPRRRIEVLGDSTPSFPEDFNRKLQNFDPDLWITWHYPPHVKNKPGRWKIEMCTRHSGETWPSGTPKHSHLCDRTYVAMVQDDDGTPLPLGEHVISKLQAMRAYSESFGGQTERGRENFIRHSNGLDADLAAKREAASEDVKTHNSRFNRRQLKRLADLVARHDMRPNK